MVEIEIKQCTCAVCSISFWLSSAQYTKLIQNHSTFYCPNGHTNYFPQKTDCDILKESKEILQKECDKKTEEIKKLKLRLHKCPKCNYDNYLSTAWALKRHLKNVHKIRG